MCSRSIGSVSLLAVSVALGGALGRAASDDSLTPRQIFYKKPVQNPVQTAPRHGRKSSRGDAPQPDPPPTSFARTAATPLVLKYSIKKAAPSGDYKEVDSDSTFHSGDSIRVSVEANDGAFLYIAHTGSTGKWDVLFPSPDTGTQNRIDPRKAYDIPGTGSFDFDEHAGIEKLYIVLSRNPEPQLQRLIENPKLRDKPDSHTLLMADSTVKNVQEQFKARDLRFQKERVDPHTRDNVDREETAVYIVNAAHDTESPVVAELELRHR
ncbi:MAG: DUF4384 domain-containing protein [Acidobacteriota bacterium]|nr:DUF4384 domain-containing protein [Acidobacteriota bacterium]